MSLTKKVEHERWIEFLSMFTNGNRGRMVSIEIDEPSDGDEELTTELPLYAIDYDPVNKGNDLVVSIGLDDVAYSHTIAAPVDISQLQDDTGKVSSLVVTDQNGIRTIISFK